MDMLVCPKCKMRVLPRVDGTCPSCQAPLKAASRAVQQEPRPALPARTSTVDAGLPDAAPARPARTPRPASSTKQSTLKPVKLAYGEVLLDAARITWKHKVLWIPALVLNVLTVAYFDFVLFWAGTILNQGNLQNPESVLPLVNNRPTSILAFLFLYIILCAFLGNFVPIMLVQGTAQVAGGKGPLQLGGLFKDSLPFFWRQLGLMFALGTAIVVVLLPLFCIIGLLLALVARSVLAEPMGMILNYLFLLIVEVPVIGLMFLATGALIIEKRGINDAIKRGWEVFTRNLKSVLLIAIPITLIEMLPAYASVFPVQLAATRLTTTFSGNLADLFSKPLYIGIATGFFLLSTMIISLVTVYYQAAWTLTFLRLTRPVSRKA